MCVCVCGGVGGGGYSEFPSGRSFQLNFTVGIFCRPNCSVVSYRVEDMICNDQMPLFNIAGVWMRCNPPQRVQARVLVGFRG